ncbi:MAG: hypothetical protein AAB654_12420 [Acidobacteriota bacterium]
MGLAGANSLRCPPAAGGHLSSYASPKQLAAATPASFAIAGTLVFRHSVKPDAGVVRNVPLENGAAVTLAGLKGTLSGVAGREDAVDFDIVLDTFPDDFEFEDVELQNPDGKKVRGSMSKTLVRIENGPARLTLCFHGARTRAKTIDIKYSAWPRLRRTRFPYRVTVPVAAARTGSAPQAVAPAPAQPAPQSAEAPAQGEWPLLKIGGIMATPGRKTVAIINNRVTAAGETIEGVEVVEISPGKVVLRYNGIARMFQSGNSTR